VLKRQESELQHGLDIRFPNDNELLLRNRHLASQQLLRQQIIKPVSVQSRLSRFDQTVLMPANVVWVVQALPQEMQPKLCCSNR
jgi:hypothetical protein